MLTIKTIVVTPYQQNARIMFDDESGVIVDPGGDIPMILDQLPDHVTIQSIWITHSHIDHVSGVVALINGLKHRQSVAPKIMAHPDDKINRDHLSIQSQMMGFPYSGDFSVDQFLNHGDQLVIGNATFTVLHTPGHAIGHVSFYTESKDHSFEAPLLIAGDALFKGSIGRTDLPGGNHQQLLDSISQHLFGLPDETIVCSGHGPNTLIGTEKSTNPFFN